MEDIQVSPMSLGEDVPPPPTSVIFDCLMYMRICDMELPNLVNPELLRDSNGYSVEFAEKLIGAS